MIPRLLTREDARAVNELRALMGLPPREFPAPAPATPEPIPHTYWPDYQAMGDCRVCGNTRQDCDRFQAELAERAKVSQQQGPPHAQGQQNEGAES